MLNHLPRGDLRPSENALTTCQSNPTIMTNVPLRMDSSK
jgi:hypothetical protein